MTAEHKAKDVVGKPKVGFVNQATINALARVEQTKAAIVALEFAWNVLSEHSTRWPGTRETDPFHSAYVVMRGKLFEELVRCEGEVAMWGHLTSDKKLQREAIKVATRFVALQNASIMDYLTVAGVHPGAYLSKTHDAFRKELNKAIERETGDKGAEGDESVSAG